MKEYCYHDIELGHEESFAITIKQDMLDKFKEITGDVNPLHNDLQFCIGGGGIMIGLSMDFS